MGICPDHKLSKMLKIKYFNGMKFCLGNLSSDFEKEVLINKIKQMGGKIIEKVTDGCIMLTE